MENYRNKFKKRFPVYTTKCGQDFYLPYSEFLERELEAKDEQIHLLLEFGGGKIYEKD